MSSTNPLSQNSLTASFIAIAEETGLAAKARNSASIALDESFTRSKSRKDLGAGSKPTPLPKADATSTRPVISLTPPPYAPGNADNMAAVLNLLEKNKSARMEELQLCRLIQRSPDSSKQYFLRAMIRQDAGNDLRSVDDYERVLQIAPDNVLAKLTRLSCLARTFGSLRESDVANITKAKRELLTKPGHRFAVIIRSGLGGPGAPRSTFEQEFSAARDAAYNKRKDRCVSALMTVMLFQQWFWRSDSDCLYRARDSARQMLELWPRDRLVASVLYWLREKARYGSISDLKFRRDSKNLYHKSHLIRRAIFDYPILIQIPEIRPALQDIRLPS